MEKAWPPLKECVQYKIRLMGEALRRYPWEEDGYEFDFESFHPPIPDELASLRKLLDSLKRNGFRPPSFPEDIRNCPFCLHPNTEDHNTMVVDILNHPVWDMDPIPCPFHIAGHLWPYGGAPCLVTRQELDNTMKYLNQVRNSRGYDVDCAPHEAFVTPEFWKFDLDSQAGTGMSNIMKGKLNSTAIQHINLKTGKIYQLEDILKIVFTSRGVYLVTFTAKVENVDSAACETFIATIDTSTEALFECLLKPDCDAPGPDHYPNAIILPIKLPYVVMRGRAPEARKKKFKKFSFRGVDLNALLGMPTSSQVKLLSARARRTYQRGLKRKALVLIKKLRKAKRQAPPGEKPALVRTHLRNMIIIPEMIGSILGVYNGKTFNTVEIKPEMIGHYTGEFSISYKPVKHGRPGIGATHSSRFIPLK